MSKRKVNDGLPIFKILIVLLGFAATAMIFFDSLFYQIGSSAENRAVITGIEAAFGKELMSLGSLVKIKLDFNIFVTLAYGLPIIGAVLISANKGKFGYLIGAVIFIAATILLGTMTQYVKINSESVIGNGITSVDWSLAWGTIIAMITSGLAGLLSIFQLIKE